MAVAEASWARDREEATVVARRELIKAICDEAARRPEEGQLTRSDRIDAELLHPWRGWIYFLATMFAVFWAIFSFAEIPMGWIEAGQGWLQELIGSMMAEGDLRQENYHRTDTTNNPVHD